MLVVGGGWLVGGIGTWVFHGGRLDVLLVRRMGRPMQVSQLEIEVIS